MLTGPLATALQRVRAAAGTDRNVVILGGELGRQCLRAGELDEILVHIAPVILGAGTPAFATGDSGDSGDTGGQPRTLRVLERSGADEMTTLRLAAGPDQQIVINGS